MLRFCGKLVSATRNFFRKKEEGATAVEYGLMVAAIAAVIVGTVVSLGGKVKTAFVTVDTEIGKATPGGGGGATP